MLAALAPAVLALLAAGASAQQPFSVTKMGYGDAGIPGGATLNFGISGVMERMPMKNDDEAEHEAEPDEHDEHEHEEHADHDEHDVEVEQEDDMHVGTWWYAAHQAEMEAQEQNPDQEYKEGPETLLMNDFNDYVDVLSRDYLDKAEELKAVLSKQYPEVKWAEQPQHAHEEEGGHDADDVVEDIPVLDLILYYNLNDIFHTYKTKDEAEALVKFLDTLAPDAPAKNKKLQEEEAERVSKLSDEDYEAEFGVNREGVEVGDGHESFEEEDGPTGFEDEELPEDGEAEEIPIDEDMVHEEEGDNTHEEI